MADDRIQHGIDDDPNNDAEKGAVLGGVGGAAVGAAAGSMAGPIGAVIGGVIGAAAGAAGSAAGVAAVDRVDNDNTVTGLGDGATTDVEDQLDDDVDDPAYATRTTAYNTASADVLPGNNIPGVQTGGRAIDGTPDTRGVMEKTADAATGDRLDDKTGKVVR